MKTILKITALYFCLAPLAGCMSYKSAAQGPYRDDISYQTFYDDLGPYGNWIDYPGHGYVWAPNVASGFSPYSTNGHWVYTNYGWTWVSGYRWGWAPFHYGRWFHDNYYGWLWVPGREWGPAWVAWRSTPQYYGWAPLGPGMSVNININIPYSRWTFVPQRYITNRYVWRHSVTPRQNITIIRNSTIINNTYIHNNNRYYAGPPRREIERVTNSNIRPARVFSNEQPGATHVSNNSVRIFRPQVAASSTTNDRTPAPERVTPANHSNTPASRPRRATNNSNNQPEQRSNTNDAAPARTQAPPTRSEARPTRQNPASQNPAPVRRSQRESAPAPERRTSRPAAQPTQARPQRARESQRSSAPAQRNSGSRNTENSKNTAPRR